MLHKMEYTALVIKVMFYTLKGELYTSALAIKIICSLKQLNDPA